jgi:hypothetical protein
MAHKHVFEAVNRTFHHDMGVVDPALKDIFFGGKVVIMGGDFRQILLVVAHGTRGQIVDASLKRFVVLWHRVKVCQLHENMRVRGFWHKTEPTLRPMPNNSKLGQTTCNALGRAHNKSFLRLGRRLF